MTDIPKRLRRRWLYLPFAIAGAILFAYFLLWRAGAEEMKKGVHAWVAEQRAAGLEVAHGDIAADGFPFFLRLHVDDPAVASPGAWRWRTRRLTLDALPYDLNRLIFSVRDDQYFSTLTIGEWKLQADDFRASIANDKARDWVFSATVGAARALRLDGAGDAAIDRLVFDLSPDPEDKTTLVLSLAGDGFAANESAENHRLDRVQTVVAAKHADALGDPALWRDRGGEIVINGFFVQLDEARLAIAGQVTLDENLQPAGDLKTEIIAPAPLTHALAKTGAMSEAEAESAAAALTLAAIAGGGKITAPLEFRDGAAHVAGVRLFEFSE